MPAPCGVEGGLLPCPFCGGEAELHGYHAPEFWVLCPTMGCKASTESFGSKERAIAAWNRRPTPPASDALRVAASRLLAVFDQQRMTTAERIIAGISDAGLKVEGNAAIDALRQALSAVEPEVGK